MSIEAFLFQKLVYICFRKAASLQWNAHSNFENSKAISFLSLGLLRLCKKKKYQTYLSNGLGGGRNKGLSYQKIKFTFQISQ